MTKCRQAAQSKHSSISQQPKQVKIFQVSNKLKDKWCKQVMLFLEFLIPQVWHILNIHLWNQWDKRGTLSMIRLRCNSIQSQEMVRWIIDFQLARCLLLLLNVSWQSMRAFQRSISIVSQTRHLTCQRVENKDHLLLELAPLIKECRCGDSFKTMGLISIQTPVTWMYLIKINKACSDKKKRNHSSRQSWAQLKVIDLSRSKRACYQIVFLNSWPIMTCLSS